MLSNQLLDLILTNLLKVFAGFVLFAISYLSNMCFSIWYNVKVLKQTFDWARIFNSILKILVFGIGTTLLCLGITIIPVFCADVGLQIPEEYQEVFQSLTIIVVFITTAFKYIKEAYSKFSKILIDDTSEKKQQDNIAVG